MGNFTGASFQNRAFLAGNQRISSLLVTHHCRWPGTEQCRRCSARREIPCPALPWCQWCHWWGWFPATLLGPCTLNTWMKVQKLLANYRSKQKTIALLHRSLSSHSVTFMSGSLNISKIQFKLVLSCRDSSVLVGLAGGGRYREKFEWIPLEFPKFSTEVNI